MAITDVAELDELRSIEELASAQKEVRVEISKLNEEAKGLPFNEEQRELDAALKTVDKEAGKRIQELTLREGYIRAMAESSDHLDVVRDDFLPRQRTSAKEQDIYDLSTLDVGGYSERGKQQLRDRAMRAVEITTFPHPSVSRKQDEVRSHIEQLMGTVDDPTVFHRRILNTGSPTYARAFGKTLVGQLLTNEETRALSLASAGGGYAVPFTLDPTIIPTSNGTVNPLRAISRVIQITEDEWRGVTSGAITVAYAAEATETTDNSPTLAQPTISTEKAQAFIPFSIEIGMDWPSLQVEMARLLQEGKDDTEAVKFVTGTGTNEPFGVITGATNTVNATTGQTFDAEDLYRLEATLPARYRARAAFMANRAIYNLIRQFTLTGQSNPWKDLDQATTVDARVGNLLGYPAFESTGMTGTTATGVKFLLLGDFSRFVIVDRIGLNVELIPHLFGTTANYPTGQRGLYAYFRNGSKVVDANAFRLLIGIA